MRSPRQRISACSPTYPPTPRPLRRGLFLSGALGSPRVGESWRLRLRGAACQSSNLPAFAVPNNFPLHACDKATQRILPPVWCRRIPASQNAAQRILRGSKAKQESCGESPNQPDRLTNFNPMLLCKPPKFAETNISLLHFCSHCGTVQPARAFGSANTPAPPEAKEVRDHETARSHCIPVDHSKSRRRCWRISGGGAGKRFYVRCISLRVI